jgi:hypothetical protein
MIIDKEIGKLVESHFYNHQIERIELEKNKAEISEEGMIPLLDRVGSRTNSISDPTMIKAAKIEQRLKNDQLWIDVVTRTAKRFEGTPQGLFFNMVYVEKQPINNVCQNMYICRATYFNWRDEIINYAIAIAAEFGLIKL